MKIRPVELTCYMRIERRDEDNSRSSQFFERTKKKLYEMTKFSQLQE